MGEEIAFENGRIADFQGLVTLTLHGIILHTVMHHSSTSTYKPNFIEIGWMDGWRYGRAFETHFIRSTQRSRLKDAPASTLTAYLCHQILMSTVTLTFDLQNLIRSSVEASRYSL